MEVRNTQIFKTSIHGNLAKNRDPASIFSKVIGQELSNNPSAEVYLRCRANFTSNAAGTEAPHFVNLGLPVVNKGDKIGSFGVPATRVRRPKDESNWIPPDNLLGEVKVAGVSGLRIEKTIVTKLIFKLGKKIRILGAKIFQ